MLTLIRCPFHLLATVVTRKRPRTFCQKCNWQVTPKHTYTNSEWVDYAAVQEQCGNLSGNELTRNSSGNTQPQSSQLAEPLWTISGLKKSPRADLHYKEKKVQAKNDSTNLPPKSSQARKKKNPKKPTTTITTKSLRGARL